MLKAILFSCKQPEKKCRRWLQIWNIAGSIFRCCNH